MRSKSTYTYVSLLSRNHTKTMKSLDKVENCSKLFLLDALASEKLEHYYVGDPLDQLIVTSSEYDDYEDESLACMKSKSRVSISTSCVKSLHYKLVG